MYTLKDRVILGGISGVLGLLMRDLYCFFARRIGFTTYYCWNISADLFMEGKDVKTLLGTVIGFLADIVFGSILGITFVYLLKITNSKNMIIKGWGFGVAIWLFLFGILIHNLPGTQTTAPQDAMSNFAAFLGHSIFGITMGVTVQKLFRKFGLIKDWGFKK